MTSSIEENTLLAVLNPASANGRTGRSWPQIRAALIRAGFSPEVWQTEGPGDATRLAQRALLEGYSRIVAVGGDGTVNEVANGFYQDGKPINPEAALAIISGGTGCDFIKTVGVPKDLAGSVAALKQQPLRRIDLGLASFCDRHGNPQSRYFINIAEAGLGGAVVDRVNRTSKALGGFASFLAGTLATFLSYRNTPVQVTLDDGPPLDLTASNVIVANGQYFGGGMQVAPHAQPDDGLFDVLIMGDLTRGDLFANIAKIYQGTHLQHPKITVRQARRVTVTSSEPLLLDIDGEQAGMAPVTFTLLPAAIQVIAPLAGRPALQLQKEHMG